MSEVQPVRVKVSKPSRNYNIADYEDERPPFTPRLGKKSVPLKPRLGKRLNIYY